MMLEVVSTLPEGVSISEYPQKKATKRKYTFFKVTSCGYPFYIPITKEAWAVLGLKDDDFQQHDDSINGEKIMTFTCHKPNVDEFLRQIINAIYLQVRDNVLGGVEDSVMRTVEDRLNELLRPSLRVEIDRQATVKTQGLLKEVGDAKD